MKKWMLSLFVFILIGSLLIACNKENENSSDNDEELFMLEVDFEVPEHADVGETFEIKATVTYGDEMVKDAHEVVFEVWEKNDKENSEMIDAINHEDGTYTTELTFDSDGIYEMFAHTTAKDQHTMPKREVVIGEGGEYDDSSEDHDGHFHTEGFDMHFEEPKEIKSGELIEFQVHLMLDNDALQEANVRYEIWSDDESEHEWVDADEVTAGNYAGEYEFSSPGKYHIQIHVRDDDDLHEHSEYELDVK